MPDISPLDELRQTDENNYALWRKTYENECRIIDDLVACYDTYSKALRSLAISPSQELARAIICGVCRKHLVLGAVALLRRHGAMMHRETRSAVEAAGIAHAIQGSREMLEIFLEDDTKSDHQKLKKKTAKYIFKPETIFPHDIPCLKKLDEFYRTASARSHNNVTSFALSVAKGIKGKTYIATQDIHSERHFLVYCLWLCFAHIAILETGDIIFPNSPDLYKFKCDRQYIAQKVVRFQQKHKAQSTI